MLVPHTWRQGVIHFEAGKHRRHTLTHTNTHTCLATAMQEGRSVISEVLGAALDTADGRHLPELRIYQGQNTIERGVSIVIKQPTHTHKHTHTHMHTQTYRVQVEKDPTP